MTVDQALLDRLWDFDDPAGSESRLRAAAAVATPSDRGELDTQVARALGLQGRYAEADAVLDAVDSAGSSDAVVRVALERGRVRNSSGDPAAATPFFRAAAAHAEEPFLRVDALHMLAIADPEDAQSWTARALDILSAGADDRTQRWRVALHENLGWILFDAGDPDGALTEFESALAAAERWGTPQQVGWARDAIEEASAARGGIPER